MRFIVRGCRAGWFGPQCQQRCPYCLHGGQCHSVSGECVCPAGFNGTRCQTSCAEAQFGQTCRSLCPSNSCRGRLMCVPDPYGCSCPSGWTGKACDEGCPLGTYGPDCAFTCGQCANPAEVCDRFTGACPAGCRGTSLVLPPLCLPLWPWFRDPPTVVRVDFRTVTIQHPAWDPDYDNGFGTANLRYIVQFREHHGGEESWQRPRRGATTDRVSDGGYVEFTLENLTIDTNYDVRIIIRDRSKRSTMDDEDKVTFVNVTTPCEAPGKVNILDSLDSIDSESTQIRLELENAAIACPPNELVTSFVETSSARKGFSSIPVISSNGSATMELSGLKPYTQYTLTVWARNRKGDGPATTVNFRTAEKAPSQPLSVFVSLTGANQAIVTWRPPAEPNGNIRYYTVNIEHGRYLACKDEVRVDNTDRASYNTTDTSIPVALKHAISFYSVSVRAVTVAPGPSATETFESDPRAPRAGPFSTGVTAGETSLRLTWSLPDCTTWNDREPNLRLHVIYRKSSGSFDTESKTFRSLSAELSGLSPFTGYLLKIYLENTVGRYEPPTNLTARTLEAAPSRVESLSSVPLSALEFVISWSPPASPNGIIRQYLVVVEHVRYRACGGSGMDRMDTKSYNTSVTALTVTLRHAFSLYSVTVAAVTVTAGPSAEDSLATGPTAPKTGISVLEVEAKKTSFEILWRRPSCASWNDAQQSTVLFVEILGRSPWDHGSETRNISAVPAVVEGLTPYSNYTLRMFLGNSAGISPTPVIRHGRTLQTLPGPPREVAVLTVSSTSVTLGWHQPLPPLSRITGYKVRYRQAGSDAFSSLMRQAGPTCPGDSTLGRNCILTARDLAENVNYTFEVSAYAYDVGRYGSAVTVNGTTKEGIPGPPESLRADNFSKTSLHISWLEPLERNGVIVEFQLNVTFPAPSSDGSTSPPRFFRTHRISGQDKKDSRYHHIQRELSPGRRYLVSVAARTSAGFGPVTFELLDTTVAPPQVAPPTAVDTSQVTDSTVPTRLPTVSGEAVSHYYTVVSTNAGFDASVLTPDHLPNSDEAREQNLDYYVAAVLPKEDVERNSSFVFGDGKYYKGAGRSFYNQPLQKGTTYKLGTVVAARLSEGNQEFTYKAFPGLVTVEAPSDAGLIAGIVFGVLIAVVAAVMAALVYRRRELQAKEPVPENTPDGMLLAPFAKKTTPTEEMYFDPAAAQMPAECIYENLQSGQINFTRIAVSDLSDTLRRDAETGQLKRQLLGLPSGMSRPCDYGRQLPNRAKNRYGNLIAYDDSRVVLEKLPDDEFSDYINASYIDGYRRPGAYIATQGPKPETVFDFWRMVWQKRCRRIVMLTNLVEGAKRKCDLYWPEEAPLEMPGMCVSKENQADSSDFVVRTLSIVKGGEKRTVTHLHYTAWPDHSVPLYPSSLAKFVRVLDSVPDGAAPTVVHCSAGVGRTGTVILIDALYKMGREEQAVDVYSHLAVARRQRANMCANYEQYKLVHQVLVELLVAPDSAIPAGQLAARLPQLRSVADGPSELEQQLSYLHSNPPAVSYSTALSENLEGKNRSPEILPEDKSRVFLHGAGRDNYVNAVYVAGYRRPDGFIATEAPLPGRRSVFWQMVAQKHSQTIVVLNNLQPDELFWPQDGEDLIYGNLQVALKKSPSTSVPPFGNVNTLEVQLKVFNKDKSVSASSLRLFVLPVDPSPGALPAAQDLAELYIAYERSRPSGKTGPTVVVCRTGVTGCGVFLASCFVLARVAEEQEVDVLQAVALVRRSRPQFVATLKQFDLCYAVALAWLEAFDTYANFH